MPFPQTQDELKSAGYVWQNDATCKGCGADISWYKTPKGSMMPMDPMDRGAAPAVPHWSTCPDRDTFRKAK
jgi:hypothetical protein